MKPVKNGEIEIYLFSITQNQFYQNRPVFAFPTYNYKVLHFSKNSKHPTKIPIKIAKSPKYSTSDYPLEENTKNIKML